jgi:ABC-type phosphate transport system substrate-binding protein
MRFFALQNAAGNYETPGIKATVAAANTVKSVPADNAISIVNPAKSAKDAYPCATFTYIIVRPNSPDRQLLKQWILFAVSPTGQKLGQPLVFAPLPHAVAVAANHRQALAQPKEGFRAGPPQAGPAARFDCG